jgi:HAD superfamily hydrolase (TIGR01509 family)
MTIKAVLFDMDGVLIDAKDWHYDALNQALDLFGMAISRDEHLAIFDGLPTRRKLELLGKTRNLPTKLHSFINEVKQKRTMELVATRCAPLFHHQYALSRLKRDGIQIAVCSNSIRATVGAMMERAALAPYIDFYLSNEDVAKAKPDPEIYVTAMERLGLSPAECIIVEDNDHGLRAARASGAHVLEVGTVYDVTYDRIRDAMAIAQNGVEA